jgi:hypothetical protein
MDLVKSIYLEQLINSQVLNIIVILRPDYDLASKRVLSLSLNVWWKIL